MDTYIHQQKYIGNIGVVCELTQITQNDSVLRKG